MKRQKLFVLVSLFSIPTLLLVVSLSMVRSVGDDYCFASKYQELGLMRSFGFWYFEWVPTFSFLPIHLALFVTKGGIYAFAVYSLFLLFLNLFVMHAVVRQIAVVSQSISILITIIFWNVIICLLALTEPLTSKLWYSTHWGLTVSRLTATLVGLLIFYLCYRKANGFLIFFLAIVLSQLSVPEVFTWSLVFVIYAILKRNKINSEVKARLLFSSSCQLLISISTVVYSRLKVAGRESSFSGTQNENTLENFLISWLRLAYHQIVDSNNLLVLVFCVFASLLIILILGDNVEILWSKDTLTILLLATTLSYAIIPGADALAYGAPWHNLQILVLSGLLKIVFLCKIINRFGIWKLQNRVPKVKYFMGVSFILVPSILCYTLLTSTRERVESWDKRLAGNQYDTLQPATYQSHKLQGDLESEWILECYVNWKRYYFEIK